MNWPSPGTPSTATPKPTSRVICVGWLLAVEAGHRGRTQEALALGERSREGGRLLSDRGAGAWAPTHLLGVFIEADELDRANAAIDDVKPPPARRALRSGCDLALLARAGAARHREGGGTRPRRGRARACPPRASPGRRRRPTPAARGVGACAHVRRRAPDPARPAQARPPHPRDRSRSADRERAEDRPARSGRGDEHRHRPRALRQPQNGQDPRLPRLRQARPRGAWLPSPAQVSRHATTGASSPRRTTSLRSLVWEVGPACSSPPRASRC